MWPEDQRWAAGEGLREVLTLLGRGQHSLQPLLWGVVAVDGWGGAMMGTPVSLTVPSPSIVMSASRTMTRLFHWTEKLFKAIFIIKVLHTYGNI